MAQPTPIGPAVDSGVTVYYVPPPGRAPNVFTSFYAGFLKQRLPLAQQVFAERLSQMRPIDRTEALADLDKLESEHMERMSRIQQATITGDSRVRAAELSALARVAAANAQTLRQERKFEEARALTTDDMTEEYSAFRTIATDPQALPGTLELVLQEAVDSFAGLDPGKRAAASHEVMQTIDLIGQRDPDTAARLRAKTENVLGVPMEPTMSGAPLVGLPRGGGGTFMQGATAGGAGPGYDPSTDPYLQRLQARRERLQREHGTVPYVDFNAPVIGSNAGPFIQTFRSLLESQRGAAPPAALAPAPDVGAPARTPRGGAAERRGRARRREEPTPRAPLDIDLDELLDMPDPGPLADANTLRDAAGAGTAEPQAEQPIQLEGRARNRFADTGYAPGENPLQRFERDFARERRSLAPEESPGDALVRALSGARPGGDTGEWSAPEGSEVSMQMAEQAVGEPPLVRAMDAQEEARRRAELLRRRRALGEAPEPIRQYIYDLDELL